MTLSRADVQGNCNIITTVPFFGGPTIIPLAPLAVRFATTGKPSHKQNLGLLLLRFRSHSLPSPSDAVHSEVTWYKFPPLSLLLLGTSCLGRPSGDVPCASEDMACGN